LEKIMLNQLIHNGIVVPELPRYLELSLVIRGQERRLTPLQEEMALAWAKKIGTEYVQDPGFVRNFIRDFSAALGIRPPLSLEEVDFSPALAVVQAERAAKEAMTTEERKALAAARKAQREELKEKYGHAIVDGERVELGNYMAEPSGIFMGRGKHPLRGKWKQGARQSDITLNLSKDAPRPKGDWAEVVWQPDSLWVARWEDKLTSKLKYVWLSDTAPVKQEREALKFDKADELNKRIEDIRKRIQQDVASDDPKQKMIATACYLIDELCLRVGDEKDPDEADTVGATTLRPEHITLHEDGTAEFDFLGKDSVRWHKKIQPPPVVLKNLEELIQDARPSNSSNDEKRRPTRDKAQIFPTIDSGHVNEYLSGILPGLTAKVFRTHHATQAVKNSLDGSEVERSDPDYEKWGAVVQANLEAAVLCNHYKKAPESWSERRERFAKKKGKAQERVNALRAAWKQASEALEAIRREAREKRAGASSDAQKERVKARYARRIEQAKKKANTARGRLQRAEDALGKLKIQDMVAVRGRTWNLGTSLKSYIDPRVYYRWGQSVDYDVIGRYYPKTLQRKFAWAKAGEAKPEEREEE
jgi:DNA topoisomerase-1